MADQTASIEVAMLAALDAALIACTSHQLGSQTVAPDPAADRLLFVPFLVCALFVVIDARAGSSVAPE